MNLSINTQDLNEGLNTVTRALSARPAKQILDGVLIKATEDRISLTCSDGSFTIEYTNVSDVKEPGQTVLPGRLLTEIIRKLPDGTVQITDNEGQHASIRCQKIRTNLSQMDSAEYPEIVSFNKGISVKIPQKKLKDMLSRVMFAIATDETRKVLTGCLLEVSRTEARIVALDGFRLAMQKLFQPFDLPDGTETVKAIIPGKVITELSRILPEDDAYCSILIDKGRMQCSFGNITLSTVLLAGEYIDYRRIISMDYSSEARTNRAKMLEAIDRASLMAREGKNNLIRINIRKNALRITSNAEMGNVEEEVECDLHGDEIDIAFNAKYIIDMIRNVSDEDLYMKFKSNVSPCIVTPPTGDQYLYLILPVRVFQ